MAWRGIPVLVTGGLGFIGSNLARRLYGVGARITVLDCRLTEYGANPFNLHGLDGQVEVVVADQGDEAAAEAVLRGVAVVFNLAGQTSHMDSMQRPLEDLMLNQMANLRFLETLRRVNPTARLIFTSTRQLYGPPRYLPVDEAHPIAPPDINGIHKYAAEAYHQLYARVYGLKATSLRLTNVYGPRMRIRDAKQGFLGVWIRHVIEGSRFEVWGGEQQRDFTYVDDLVDALLAVAETDATAGQIYNIGGYPPVSLRELADLLTAAAGQGGFDMREFPAERKKIDIGTYVADDRALRAATGWTPRTPLAEGLAATIAFYRANAAHYL